LVDFVGEPAQDSAVLRAGVRLRGASGDAAPGGRAHQVVVEIGPEASAIDRVVFRSGLCVPLWHGSPPSTSVPALGAGARTESGSEGRVARRGRSGGGGAGELRGG